jgi:hypothetical protein
MINVFTMEMKTISKDELYYGFVYLKKKIRISL